MKLSFVIVLISCIHAAASSFAQDITLHKKQAALVEVFKDIRKQSGYHIFYDERLVQNSAPVSVDIIKGTIHEVMDKCLAGTHLTYSMVDKNVIISKKPGSATTDPVVADAPLQMQERELGGTVQDSSAVPLSGVSILVKGTTRGTTSNEQGAFKINVKKGDILVFTHVGYVIQELEIADQKILTVMLESESAGLEEVVVVAYGTQKKATLTGAIASINTKEIKQSPAANLAVTLAGKLPGLFVQQTSGEPGRDATALFMRGRGTLNGSAPLILVDGVQRELTSIDPNEVETVSILKDASSTALFGVRGANGVILVTTKRGTETVPAIGLTVESGFQTFTRWPTQVDGYNWALLKNQAWGNDFPNPGPNDAPPYSDYALERFKLQDFPEVYPNNNWIDQLMNRWVPQTRYNLTLNGKGANVGYFINVGYLDQSGQWKIDPSQTAYDPSQFMKRYNFRSNIDAFLNKSKTLKTFLNASGYLERVNGPFVGGTDRFSNNTTTAEIINRILNAWPTVQPGPLTPDGQVLVGSGSLGESPWAEINRTGYRRESRSNLTASWGLEQNLDFLTKGLSTKVMLSFDTRSIHYLNASQQYQYWVQLIDPNTQTADGRDSVYYQRTRTDFDNTPLSTSISASFQSFYEVQWHVNYNRTFGEKHAVTGLILGQQQSLIKPTDALPFNVRGLATRLTYAYDNRYILEFNAGYNGSEQFAKGKRYGFFPSISAAWNMQNEAFFASLAPTINQLKLRGSYGTVGGDQLGDRRFLYLDDIQRGGGSYSATLGRGADINESFFGNPNVQWEVAKKANAGIELGLFNQLTLIADFFKERRDNVLIYRGSIPLLIGVPSNTLAPANIGIIENKGYEIELDYNKSVNKDLYIVGKLNMNYASNKILFNDEVELSEDYAYRYRTTGYQIGQQWGYQALGFFNSQEDIDAYGVTYQGRAPRPGDLKFADLNGDHLIDDKDQMPIGRSSIPMYSWGAAASITYKNIDLSFLFQGAFDVSGQYNPYEINDFRTLHLDAWTPERAASGYDIRYPALSLNSSASQNSNTFFNQSRSFVRLKNLELGYHLPKLWVNRIRMKDIRFYVNGLNIFTWDKLNQKDWDPELSGTTSFPVYKVLNIGINATF